ncbi:hypothetical protein HYC85_023811 [Camellia sinensis]|uniref:Metal-nicotianamine transporter YSL7 n=1 Tax=Camellia sinensis TaxID=4442 RepID=A0A7J7GFK1_CAMSI|nr:hypothetical protein HYC85_023811 [Camellia sinensis]
MERGGGGEEGDEFDGGREEKMTMERVFKNSEVPSWKNQITMRSMVTSFVLSIVFNFIVCKLNLTTGVIPSLNVAAGLLGFAMIKAWTALLHKLGLLKQPFTRQENTVIQTCVVASSGIAFSSGTASYLLGMSGRIAAQADEASNPINVKNLSLGWMIGFLFLVSFVGLFSIVPLRKMMILKYKLTYPSGTATAYLINSFHTPKGAKLANFTNALFQWFFAAADGCGFSNFPTFGLKAFSQRFYFDFSATYVGVGMICPYMVNISLLIGAIISWGIMWPQIEKKRGHWYSADLPSSSLHGIQGYRVFLAIAMMLGDGLFHVIYMIIVTLQSLISQNSNTNRQLSSSSNPENYDERRRTEYFLKDQIPNKVAVAGYIALAAISIGSSSPNSNGTTSSSPTFIAPILAFCNAYGCGLTDWSLASNYGKLAIIIFSSWVGLDHGGIIAGLASCGVMMSIVSTASDLMQDFKTGYSTLASPRSMFFSQVLGTCDGLRDVPIGLLRVFRRYQRTVLNLPLDFFVGAIVINVIREVLKQCKCNEMIWGCIPSPMCMAIPFYLGGYFAIDMCVGSMILFVWEKVNKQKAKDFVPAVASGLICGESLWGVPAAVLSLAGATPPICMKFLSAASNKKVDGFLDITFTTDSLPPILILVLESASTSTSVILQPPSSTSYSVNLHHLSLFSSSSYATPLVVAATRVTLLFTADAAIIRYDLISSLQCDPALLRSNPRERDKRD